MFPDLNTRDGRSKAKRKKSKITYFHKSYEELKSKQTNVIKTLNKLKWELYSVLL